MPARPFTSEKPRNCSFDESSFKNGTTPPQFSIRQLLDRLKQSPPTLRKGARGAQLARSLQFIFDIGDVAAHTEVSNPRLRWLKYTRPATDGTIRRSISNFERVAGGVKWK